MSAQDDTNYATLLTLYGTYVGGATYSCYQVDTPSSGSRKQIVRAFSFIDALDAKHLTSGDYATYLPAKLYFMNNYPSYDDSAVKIQTPILSKAGAPGAPIALGILGQSNEKGQLPSSQRATYPTCFQSALNPAVNSMMGYSNALDSNFYGSWWPAFYDLMLAYGYDMQMVNGAFGSVSFVDHVCGRVKGWSAGAGYFQERTTRANTYDRGYIGDVIVESNRIFRCTTGNQIYVTYRTEQFDGASPIGTTIGYVNRVGSAVTGGTKPAGFATATKDQTITDGGITWTCVSATNNIGLFTGQVFHSGINGYGFDPLGLLDMLHERMSLKTGVVDKYIHLCNGQADTGNAGTTYQQALGYIVDYFRARNYKVAIGLSSITGGGSAATWDQLSTDVDTVYAAKSATDTGVVRASNLYRDIVSPSWQGDNVHLDGPALLKAAQAVATGYKLVLPAL